MGKSNLTYYNNRLRKEMYTILLFNAILIFLLYVMYFVKQKIMHFEMSYETLKTATRCIILDIINELLYLEF